MPGRARTDYKPWVLFLLCIRAQLAERIAAPGPDSGVRDLASLAEVGMPLGWPGCVWYPCGKNIGMYQFTRGYEPTITCSSTVILLLSQPIECLFEGKTRK